MLIRIGADLTIKLHEAELTPLRKCARRLKRKKIPLLQVIANCRPSLVMFRMGPEY